MPMHPLAMDECKLEAVSKNRVCVRAPSRGGMSKTKLTILDAGARKHGLDLVNFKCVEQGIRSGGVGARQVEEDGVDRCSNSCLGCRRLEHCEGGSYGRKVLLIDIVGIGWVQEVGLHIYDTPAGHKIDTCVSNRLSARSWAITSTVMSLVYQLMLKTKKDGFQQRKRRSLEIVEV